MVESIFGGKMFPSHCNHEDINHSPSSLHQGRSSLVERFSTSPSGLHTISETEDTTISLSGSAAALVNDSSLETPRTEGRQTRAVSLPAIYRDGSYLRISFPPRFGKQWKRRRFSEPAVPWSAKEGSPILRDDGVERNSTEHDSAKSSSVECVQNKVTEARRQPIIAARSRRHSDPMLYTVVDKLQALTTSTSTEPLRPHATHKVANEISLSPVADRGKAETRETRELTADKTQPSVRRRKSSLVPIPFSMAQGQKKTKPLKKRPLSFPPSHEEESHRKNYRDLRLDLNVVAAAPRSSSTQENEVMSSYDAYVEIEHGDLPSLPDENEPNKYRCENIITRWMKFFG